MYLQLCVLCIVNVLTIDGFEVFGINDGYKGLLEKLESTGIQPRVHHTPKWIEQELDHFDASETRKWNMRYYEKLDYWKTNGPIYLLINGEATAMTSFLETGIVYELAKETDGAIYLSEHRYYGQSQPLNRSSFNVEDFKFLSAAQAMADIAMLLKTIKDNVLYKNSKVVVVGGSYAGNLAVWIKLLYPDLIDAAISSSAPVLAKRDFHEYYEVIGNDYQKYGTLDCIEKIKRMFKNFDSLFQTKDGIEQLKKEENICELTDLTKPKNKQLFFMVKTFNFIIKTQYGSVKAIESHCLQLNSLQEQQLDSDVKYFWNSDLSCYDFEYEKMLQEYYEPDNDDILCWTYQSCTEFGYFQSTSTNNQPFTKNIPLEWYDQFCTDLFGANFDKDRVNRGVKETNAMYGGKSPNVNNVVFVIGELDPWQPLGITKDGPLNDPVVYIPRSSHCRDLFSNDDEDEEELKQARSRIKSQIKRWIGANDNDEHNEIQDLIN